MQQRTVPVPKTNDYLTPFDRFLRDLLKEKEELPPQPIFTKEQSTLTLPSTTMPLLSYLKLLELRKIVKDLKDQNLEVNKDNLQSLMIFFNQYVELILNTPMVLNRYYINSNKATIELAKLLKPCSDKTELQLLFPHAIISNQMEKIYKTSELNRIVLSDDNKTFIDVRSCLQSAMDEMERHRNDENFKLELKHTHSPDQNIPAVLTECEMHRVINHTPATLAYYQAIKNKLPLAECHLARAQFNKSLTEQSIHIGYGSAGANKLLTALHAGLNNRDDLILKLQNLPNAELRTAYLRTLTKERLFQLTLGKLEFDRALFSAFFNDDNSYNWNPQSNRDEVVSFLVQHLYKIETQSRPYQHQSWTGKLFRQPNKQDKEAGVKDYATCFNGNFKDLAHRTAELDEYTATARRDGLLKDIIQKAIDVSQQKKLAPVLKR